MVPSSVRHGIRSRSPHLETLHTSVSGVVQNLVVRTVVRYLHRLGAASHRQGANRLSSVLQALSSLPTCLDKSEPSGVRIEVQWIILTL